MKNAKLSKDERKQLTIQFRKYGETIGEQRRILQSIRGTIRAKQRRIKNLERSAAAIEHSLTDALNIRKMIAAKLGISL